MQIAERTVSGVVAFDPKSTITLEGHELLEDPEDKDKVNSLVNQKLLFSALAKV